ncbi:MAG: helix-turn-helix transcriptional regulator [Oscillibacter sp.]|jgi:transcriptional regulator with XRE-family HTH domain|nr:helix-turn-helix transcriptional regulator [Oscillibacter sp.]MEA4992527.1 helix-turn-helix transcriptional regulator [Oscillibacter sp.]
MQNLRLLREERNLSQQKLADEFDVAQAQIQNYETGGYQPDIEMLNKYADFFEVSVDFLLGRTDIRRRPEPVKECALNAEEQKLVDRYRSLRPNQRQSLDLFLDTLEDK